MIAWNDPRFSRFWVWGLGYGESVMLLFLGELVCFFFFDFFFDFFFIAV